MSKTITLREHQATYVLDEGQLDTAPFVIKQAGRPYGFGRGARTSVSRPEPSGDAPMIAYDARYDPPALGWTPSSLDNLARYRLEHACHAYVRGEVNLSRAAHHAAVSVEEMMRELEQRGIDYGPTTEQFLNGLETLAAEFDAPALGRVAAELRAHPELWEASGRS